MSARYAIALFAFSAIFSSCAIYAPQERTGLNAGLPEKFSLYSDRPSEKEDRWWIDFQSTELNRLMEEALTNSPSILQAWARLAQADAIATKAGASRLPSLNYEGQASGTRRSTVNNGKTTIENYSLGLAANYELDLWGRIKSQTEAAAFDYEASREDLNTVAITLSARVASSWIGVLSQRLQAEVLRRQLEVNKTTAELIELRFRKSLANALDVYQQRQAVAATESAIPLVELREQLLLNELAVLLGRTNLQALEIAEAELPDIGKLPDMGIPADILAGRPDVRRAGLRLRSADWSVSAALADRLPAIRLSASASYGSAELADVFDDWMANLAASVTGPVFDGWRRKAEVDRTKAVVDERLAAYRETVLNAIKEVEDALVQEQKQQEYIEALDQRLEAAKRSYEEAINRYRNGVVEYTTVLLQLTSLQTLERTRVAAQYDLLQYRIGLYRALGGNWTDDLQPPDFESEE